MLPHLNSAWFFDSVLGIQQPCMRLKSVVAFQCQTTLLIAWHSRRFKFTNHYPPVTADQVSRAL